MKVFLLHRDRDFDVKPELRDPILDAMLSGKLFGIANVKRDRQSGSEPAPPTSDDVLTQDLELHTLWSAMAAGDEFLFETAKRIVLSSLSEPEAIEYRQGVLADCLAQPAVVRQIYGLAIEALENERQAGLSWHTDRPDSILRRSVQILTLQVGVLKRLRQIAEQHAPNFRSEGFTRFFAMLNSELADDYLQTVERHLRELEFRRGVLESAGPAKGNKARRYTVHRPPPRRWTRSAPVRQPITELQLHDPLAHSLHAQQLDTVLFLRAEREPDGRRTFKLREREPLPTSYGADSYRRVFGASADRSFSRLGARSRPDVRAGVGVYRAAP